MTASLIREIGKSTWQSYHAALNSSRFDDASYYYWILSVQFADLAKEGGDQLDEMISKFYEYQQKASIYYAYHTIQR